MVGIAEQDGDNDDDDDDVEEDDDEHDKDVGPVLAGEELFEHSVEVADCCPVVQLLTLLTCSELLQADVFAGVAAVVNNLSFPFMLTEVLL